MPPFGKDAHIVLDPWMPTGATGARAVLAAKDFLLAVLYADYTGDRDHSWKNYASTPQMLSGMSAQLAEPDVSTESWTGTIRITHMDAVLGNNGPRTALVSFCENSAGSKNTSLSSHAILPAAQQANGNQNYYLVAYLMGSDKAGNWTVTGIEPNQVYPRATECKP